MRTACLLTVVVLFTACQTTPKREPITVNYPTTQKVDTVDTYFGTEVPDPYRWLEEWKFTLPICGIKG